MQDYVCGFLFSPDRTRVLLIRKQRPAWQAGRLNGVGGKVEHGETIPQAMRREFHEEAGLDITSWQHGVSLNGPDWRGHFFRAFGPIDSAQSMTDELLEIHSVRPLPADTIPNLRWIIPLLLDDDPLNAEYRVEIQMSKSATWDR